MEQGSAACEQSCENVHGSAKTIEVCHGKGEAAWPSSHGCVVKRVDIRDAEGDPHPCSLGGVEV